MLSVADREDGWATFQSWNLSNTAAVQDYPLPAAVLQTCGLHQSTFIHFASASPSPLHSTYCIHVSHPISSCNPNRILHLVHLSAVPVLFGALIWTGQCLLLLLFLKRQTTSRRQRRQCITDKPNTHHNVNAKIKWTSVARTTLAS